MDMNTTMGCVVALESLRNAEKRSQNPQERAVIAKLAQALNAFLRARGARMLTHKDTPAGTVPPPMKDYTFKVDLSVSR